MTQQQVPVRIEQTPHPTPSTPPSTIFDTAANEPYWVTAFWPATVSTFETPSAAWTLSTPMLPLDALVAAAKQLAAACREYTEAWHDPEPPAPAASLSAPAHGTRRQYRRGCKCAECRQANTAYEQARLKRAAAAA